MSEIKKKKGVWYSVILIVLIVFGTIVLVDISSEKFSLFRSAETGAVVRESTLPGYNYEISDGEYSAYFKNAISKEGSVKYVRNGAEVSFQPVEMRYVSDSRFLQTILRLNCSSYSASRILIWLSKEKNGISPLRKRQSNPLISGTSGSNRYF